MAPGTTRVADGEWYALLVAVSWIPPPREHQKLGHLFVFNDDCWHYDRHRGATLAMVRAAHDLDASERLQALRLGMFSVGPFLYRPVCDGCRRCQPFRVVVDRFEPSRSQRRVQRRCDGQFTVTLGTPRADEERLALYTLYRQVQHGDEDVSLAGTELRYLMDTHADGLELAWRDPDGALVGVGVLDVLPDGIVSEQFFWAPSTARYALGTYSALYEIELCRARGLPYYYLGPLVDDARRTRYKARYAGGEIWDGESWIPLPSRDVDDPAVTAILRAAEEKARALDATRFRLDLAVPHVDVEDSGPEIDDATASALFDERGRGPDVSDASFEDTGDHPLARAADAPVSGRSRDVDDDTDELPPAPGVRSAR